MADLEAAITNLNQQMAALLTALQPVLAGTVPTAPVSFAATPGTLNVTDIIDYSTRIGSSIYQDGIKSLYENEEKFDLQNEKATAFIDKVKVRANKMGWTDATQGITIYNVNGENVDIIEHYGLVDITDIHDQSKPWYLHNGAKVSQRAAQNNVQFFEMLMNSLAQSAIDKVRIYEDEYMLDDASGNNKKVCNAAALYKVIMRCTTLDSKSTNKALRDKIKDLPTIAVTCNGDIDSIHSYFNDAYNQLKARGGDVDDKEDLLFQAYANVPDERFVSYIERKREDYYDGIGDMRGKDWRFIMKRAKEKYDQLRGDTLSSKRPSLCSSS